MDDITNCIESVLVSKEKIDETLSVLGNRITADYKGKNLLLIGILKGSIIFMADLMRHIDLKCQIDFMRVSSYGNNASSSGNVKIDLDLGRSINDYDVLIVEDILDSGNSLFCLKNMLLARNPRSLKICTFLDKPEKRTADITADYVGITIPNAFVVGYGLDYAEDFRNLPYVGILKPEVYS